LDNNLEEAFTLIAKKINERNTRLKRLNENSKKDRLNPELMKEGA